MYFLKSLLLKSEDRKKISMNNFNRKKYKIEIGGKNCDVN